MTTTDEVAEFGAVPESGDDRRPELRLALIVAVAAIGAGILLLLNLL